MASTSRQRSNDAALRSRKDDPLTPQHKSPNRPARRAVRRCAVLASTLCLTATAGVAAVATATSAAADTPVQVWLTTQNRSDELSRKGDISLTGSASGNVQINVTPGETYQTMTGFGASFTDSSTYVINQLPEGTRNQLMRDLFTYSNGIGLSWLRQPLGSSDFTRNSNFYTYQDGGPGSALTVDRDSSSIDLVRHAKHLNNSITVMGTPWSAPAWMKQSNSLVSGDQGANRLKGGQEAIYAEYLTRVAQLYRDRGANLDYISIQNEPLFTPGTYPGMYVDAGQQAAIAGQLAPRLSQAGLSTKILGYDHNWNNTGYPSSLVTGGNSSHFAGTAWHCYEGSAGAQSTVHNANTGKGTFFTECSGTESSNRADTFKDTLWYHASQYAIPSTRNWSKTISFWNLALNQSNGPVQGSCTGNPCTGIVTANSNGTYTRNAGYYVLGHFSKFVKPGAVRIGSSGTTSSISNVAFRNSDGSTILVVHNGGGSNSIRVSVNGQHFGYSMPENSLATFTWGGSGNWGSIGGGGTAGPPPGTGGGGGDNGADPADVPGHAGAITGLAKKCVDLRSGTETKANGTAVQLYDCNGSVAQRWIVANDNTIRVRGKCLEVNGTGNGAQAYIWDCDGKNTQKWTIDGQLIKATGGRCLDVPDSNSANGNQLKLWDCFGAANQRWNAPNLSPVGTTTTIKDRANSKCVDVRGGSTNRANGTAVQIHDCNGTVAQRWTFADDESVRFGDRCLDVAVPANASGSKTQIWECTGRSNQRWQLDGLVLRNLAGNKCLDLTNGSASNGNQLQVWDCSSGPNQQWLTSQNQGTGPSGQIRGLANKCVDVSNSNTTNGTKVQLWDCNGSGAQRWTRAIDGTLRALGKCLEVNGTGNGAQAYLWDCDGKNTQKWTIDGQYIKAYGGRCLDVPDSNSANGNQLKLWDCVGAANQRWTVPA